MQQCTCNLLNQSHHILSQGKFLFVGVLQVSFRPQQEIEAKLGDGQIIHTIGGSFIRLLGIPPECNATNYHDNVVAVIWQYY